jgi:hypothetical protein
MRYFIVTLLVMGYVNIINQLKQGYSTGVREMSLGVPREVVTEKNIHRFLNLLAKINRSTEKYNSLLKRALTIIISTTY